MVSKVSEQIFSRRSYTGVNNSCQQFQSLTLEGAFRLLRNVQKGKFTTRYMQRTNFTLRNAKTLYWHLLQSTDGLVGSEIAWNLVIVTSVARKNIEIVQKIYLAGLAGLVDRTLYAVLRNSAQLGWKRWEARATRLFFRPSVPCGIPRSTRSRKVTAPWIGSRARIPTVEKLNSSSGLWTSFDSGIGFEQPFASYCFEEEERESPARVS